MDCYDSKKRSEVMRKVHSKDTSPEVFVRKVMHRAGFRFRLHRANLPGKPDIVLSKYKTAIFVHGCFWHRHSNCKRATMPAQNIEYWKKKFSNNVERDKHHTELLQTLGWKVIIIWECQIKDKNLMNKILQIIKSGS